VTLAGILPLLGGLATLALFFAMNMGLSLHAVADSRLAQYDAIAAQAAASQLQQDGVALQTAAWAAKAPANLHGAQLPSMPATSLCATAVGCVLRAVASYSVEGTTTVVGTQDQIVSSNVESAAYETRTAVVMNVQILDSAGNVMYARPHNTLLRLYGTAFADVTSTQDGASQASGLANGAAENDGCASDGTGCDPARVQAQDPTTVDAVNQCVLGIGSGTCSGAYGTNFPSAANKTNPTWQNGQSAGTSGP
jgi:hypothetical protein